MREGRRVRDDDAVDFDRFEAMLRSIDVVGVTERFDEFLLALKDVAGVRHVAYVKSNEGASASRIYETSPRRLDDVPESVADAIRSSTTMDTKAHELASRLMDERAERRFGGVGGVAAAKREAEAFRAATKEAGGARHAGGFPPKSPHKWIAAADADRVGRRASCPGVSRTRRAEDKPPRTSSSIRWCSWTRRRTRRVRLGCTMDPPREPQPRGDEGAGMRGGERRCGASDPDRRVGAARRSGACARRRASSPTRVSFILDDVLRLVASSRPTHTVPGPPTWPSSPRTSYPFPGRNTPPRAPRRRLSRSRRRLCPSPRRRPPAWRAWRCRLRRGLR